MNTENYPKIYLYKRIVEAKLFIDKHYADNIDIDAIAREACFSKFHFLRLFRQIYQVTPHKYLTMLRLQKAKELLQSGASVTETCGILGFESMSSFNKLFKRHIKLAPSVYATRRRDQRSDMKKHPLNYVPLCFVDYMGWDK